MTGVDQHCLSCARDTSAGTILFSARKRGLDRDTGVEGFLCQSCQEGSATIAPDQSIPLSGRYVVIDMPGSMQGGF